jgi:hypothetical protein
VQRRPVDSGTAGSRECGEFSFITKARAHPSHFLAGPFPTGDTLCDRGRHGAREFGLVVEQRIIAAGLAPPRLGGAYGGRPWLLQRGLVRRRGVVIAGGAPASVFIARGSRVRRRRGVLAAGTAARLEMGCDAGPWRGPPGLPSV